MTEVRVKVREGVWIDEEWLRSAGLGRDLQIEVQPGQIRISDLPAAEMTAEPYARGRSTWQQVKQEMAKEMPDLANRTMAEKRREFDRLSQLIAEHLPYDSPEEMEKAMRGDEYDLAGH